MSARRRIRRKLPTEVTGGGTVIETPDVNFPADVDTGLTQHTRLIIEPKPADLGASAVQSPFEVKTQQLPATEIVQTSVALSHQGWVTTASETPGSDWENIEDIEGNASDTGVSALTEGLVLVQGTLIGNFATQLNRDPLSIDSVKLQVYWGFFNVLLPGSTLTIQYQVGIGPIVTLRTVVGDGLLADSEDHLTVPEEFDITASGPDGLGGAWAWDDLSDIAIQFVGTILVDVGATSFQVNATRLDIESSSVVAA